MYGTFAHGEPIVLELPLIRLKHESRIPLLGLLARVPRDCTQVTPCFASRFTTGWCGYSRGVFMRAMVTRPYSLPAIAMQRIS